MAPNGLNKTHDLAIVGPLPPPFGGVSVHIKRLLGHLDRAGIDYVVYDMSSHAAPGERIRAIGRGGWRWFAGYLARAPEPVVYVHSSRWDVWAGTWWLSRVRGKSVVIAVHTDSLRRLWPVRPRWYKRAVVRAFRAAAALVAVNTHVRDFLDEIAEVGYKTAVIPAFVQPVISPEDEAGIDPAVRSFCASHHPVILANGAPIVYDDGRDLYGIDMTIELAEALRTTWPDVGVVWYLLKFTGWNPRYAERMAGEIERRGMQNHWHFAEPTGEMAPVFREVDLFVRPTCSDGDAVSVREALFFRIPTVASDAAPRPPGTILFRTRDQADFLDKVRSVLESPEAHRARLADLTTVSGVAEEVDLLKDLITRSR